MMKRVYDFLKKAGTYYLATVEGDQPRVRPFGTVNIFEAVKSVREQRKDYDPVVVVACSSAEYGATLDKLDGKEVYVKETAELLPLHPYGVSKVGQDLLSFQYFMNDHIRCIRARIFNSTGTRKVNDVTSDFTKRAVLAENSGNHELRVGNLNTYRAIMDQRNKLIRVLEAANAKKQEENHDNA